MLSATSNADPTEDNTFILSLGPITILPSIISSDIPGGTTTSFTKYTSSASSPEVELVTIFTSAVMLVLDVLLSKQPIRTALVLAGAV